jgi:hypothetical protein
MHPRRVLQRVRDKAYFEQVDLEQLAPALRLAGRAGAEAEAETAHLPCFQQLRRAAAGPVDPGDDPQAAGIFGDVLDKPDRLVGPVLPI